MKTAKAVFQVIDGLGTPLTPAVTIQEAREYIAKDDSGWRLFIRDIRK